VADLACQSLTNCQASESRQKRPGALFWAQSLVRLRGWRGRGRHDPPRDDARLVRENVVREAAISLSLGDGIPFTGREYQLLEQLWRTDP
jgi:hypothetical protein